ncbi:MAG: AAA family ATPase [Planctomycetota bacterium]
MLDPLRKNPQVKRFEAEVKSRVIGQDRVIDEVIQGFGRLLGGIRNPDRPLLTMLFMGPTGVGKTETVKAIANSIFGSKKAFVRINCQEYASSHNVAKLLGSPPGYVGSDIEPLLSQNNIDRHHRAAFDEKRGMFGGADGKVDRLFPGNKEHYLSIVLFDEIEKASPVLWNTLLAILEDGTLTLGNNASVDLTRSIIILTSNVGSREMSQIIRGQIGFGGAEEIDADIEKTAMQAAKDVFPFEFLNRFDAIGVFRTLKEEHLFEILDIQISEIHQRAVNSSVPFVLRMSDPVRRHLVEQGTDPEFGARPLRRVVEHYVVNPLSNLIGTNQVQPGDVITARLADGKIVFQRESRKDKSLVAVREPPQDGRMPAEPRKPE